MKKLLFTCNFLVSLFILFHKQCVVYISTSLLLLVVVTYIVASDFSDLYLANRDVPFVLLIRATLQMPELIQDDPAFFQAVNCSFDLTLITYYCIAENSVNRKNIVNSSPEISLFPHFTGKYYS